MIIGRQAVNNLLNARWDLLDDGYKGSLLKAADAEFDRIEELKNGTGCYLMMMKGESEVLATCNDSQQVTKQGLISIGLAQRILSDPSAKGKRNLFFVPTDNGDMPAHCKSSKVLTLDQFLKVQSTVGETQYKKVTETQKAKVLELLVNGVSINKTAFMVGVGRSTVWRLKKPDYEPPRIH